MVIKLQYGNQSQGYEVLNKTIALVNGKYMDEATDRAKYIMKHYPEICDRIGESREQVFGEQQAIKEVEEVEETIQDNEVIDLIEEPVQNSDVISTDNSQNENALDVQKEMLDNVTDADNNSPSDLDITPPEEEVIDF